MNPDDPAPTAQEATPQAPSLAKLAIEFGPLAAFLVAQKVYDIYVATGVLMAGMVVSLTLAWIRERRLPVMMLVSGSVALVFGGLTFYFDDPTFIYRKPTIVNSLFAVALTGGLVMGQLFLKVLLGPVFQITDEGWRAMTFRWILFFVFLAVVNEVIWRNFSEDTWANFKVFGNLLLSFAFSASLIPLLKRYSLDGPDGGPAAGDPS